MSVGRVIDAVDALPLDDLGLVEAAIARRRARGEVTHAASAATSRGAERTRRWRERASRGASQTVTASVTRDGAGDGVSVTERHAERHGDGQRDALARGPSQDLSWISPSDLQKITHSEKRERGSDARTRASVTAECDATGDAASVTRHGDSESVTAQAERTRKAIAAAYRERGLAVPRAVASLASTAETTAALAGIPSEALPGILARFFADGRMKAKGYPPGFLLSNPNEWAHDGPRGRDEGEARERPTETVLPEWLRTETHGGAA